MMMIISPAKKLDFKPVDLREESRPRFEKETGELIKCMKKKGSRDLMALMDISKALAELNVKRFNQFESEPMDENTKQALLAFNGDVYLGLKASDFDKKDLSYAQKHLRILSGLYGLLRPLDRIQAYRLEMGSMLHIGKHKSLYSFWGDKISSLLNEDMKEMKDKVLINLASEEYFHVVNPRKIENGIIQVRFEEKRGGVFQVISFSAKKARGLMARYIIKNRLSRPTDLKAFDTERYEFSPNRSSDILYTFVR